MSGDVFLEVLMLATLAGPLCLDDFLAKVKVLRKHLKVLAKVKVLRKHF